MEALNSNLPPSHNQKRRKLWLCLLLVLFTFIGNGKALATDYTVQFKTNLLIGTTTNAWTNPYTMAHTSGTDSYTLSVPYASIPDDGKIYFRLYVNGFSEPYIGPKSTINDAEVKLTNGSATLATSSEIAYSNSENTSKALYVSLTKADYTDGLTIIFTVGTTNTISFTKTSGSSTDTNILTGDNAKPKSGLTLSTTATSSSSSLAFGSDYNGWEPTAVNMKHTSDNRLWRYTINASENDMNRNIYFRFYDVSGGTATGDNGIVANESGNKLVTVGSGKEAKAGDGKYAVLGKTANAKNTNNPWYFNTGSKYKTFYIEAALADDGNWYATVTGADERNNYEISTDGGKTWTVATSPVTLSSTFESVQLRKGTADGTQSYFVPTTSVNTSFNSTSNTIAGGFTGNEAASFTQSGMTPTAANFARQFRLTFTDTELKLEPLYSHSIYVHDFGDASSEVSDNTYIKTDEGAVKLRGNSDIVSVNGISWYRYNVNTVNAEQTFSMGEDENASTTGTDIKSGATPTYWCYEKTQIKPSSITDYQYSKVGSNTWNTMKSSQDWSENIRPFYLRKVVLDNHNFTVTYYKATDNTTSATLQNSTAYTTMSDAATSTDDATKFTFDNNVNGETFGYTMAFDGTNHSMTLTAKTDGTALFILAGKNISDLSRVCVYKQTSSGDVRYKDDNSAESTKEYPGVLINSLPTVVDAYGTVWYKWVNSDNTGLRGVFTEEKDDKTKSDKKESANFNIPSGVSYWYYDATTHSLVGSGDNFNAYQYKAVDDATWTAIVSGQTVFNGYMPIRLRKITVNDKVESVQLINATNASSDHTYTFTSDNGMKTDGVTLQSQTLGTTDPERDETRFTTKVSSDRGFALSISDTEISLGDYDKAHYYLVISEANGGKRMEYLRMKPQRYRVDSKYNDDGTLASTNYYTDNGVLSDKYYVINLKADEIKKLAGDGNSSVHYWIEKVNLDGSEGATYRPSADNLNLLSRTQTTMGKGNNVSMNDYDKNKNPWDQTQTQGYVTTTDGSNTFELDNYATAGVSYTWYWDATHNSIVQATNLKPLTEEATNGKYNYYVIGNFNNQVKGGAWNPTEDNGRRLMKRYIYKKGVATEDYTTTVNNDDIAWLKGHKEGADVDSVVYKATINRPANGWSDLYLAFAKESLVKATSLDWWDIIRPEGQWWGTQAVDNKDGSGMDVSSLRGGLFQCTTGSKDKDNDDNHSQALDPVVDAYRNATAYTVSINMTTSTYRIDFDTKVLYIVGNAVRGNKAEYGKWRNDDSRIKTFNVNLNGTDTEWNALPLQYVDADDAYEYRDENGIEKPIVMLRHKTNEVFRFSHLNSTENGLADAWYGEDGNIPMEIKDVKSNVTSVGGDVPYFNHLNMYDAEVNGNAVTTDASNYEAGKNTNKNIEFRMGNNKYYIRFHIDKSGDQPVYYYEVIPSFYMNDFTEDDPLGIRTVIFNRDRYFRMFSDHQARVLPEGIDMYVVNDVDYDSNIIKVQKVISDFIPANTGVLLATRDVTSSSYLKTHLEAIGTEDPGIMLQLPLYTKNVNAKLPSNIKNLLVASTDYTYVPATVSEGSTTKYNYVFWYTPRYGAAFYIPIDNYYTSRNSCYLQLDNSTRGIGSTEKNDDGTITGSSVAAKFAIGFLPMWDSNTTGIDGVRKANSSDSAYYTLDGVRVSKPTAKGVYIHNGKKFIIR